MENNVKNIYLVDIPVTTDCRSDCMVIGYAKNEIEAIEVAREYYRPIANDTDINSDGDFNVYHDGYMNPSYNPDIQTKEEAEDLEKYGAFVVTPCCNT